MGQLGEIPKWSGDRTSSVRGFKEWVFRMFQMLVQNSSKYLTTPRKSAGAGESQSVEFEKQKIQPCNSLKIRSKKVCANDQLRPNQSFSIVTRPENMYSSFEL